MFEHSPWAPLGLEHSLQVCRTVPISGPSSDPEEGRLSMGRREGGREEVKKEVEGRSEEGEGTHGGR